MKKAIFLLVTLVIACSGEASAQKWLKNVGKALEKVDKFLDTSTTSSSSSSTKQTSDKRSATKRFESQYGDVSLTNAITGVNVTYKGVVRTAPDKGVIDLLFLNSDNEDIIVYDLKRNITIFDTEGNQYTDYTVLLGNDHTTWGGYRFRAGIPTRVKLQVERLPASQAVTIHTAKFQSSLKSDASESNPLEIHNVVIPAYDSQLAEGAVKSDPGPFGMTDGYWGKESDGVARSISFAPEGVKAEFGNRITYGIIVTMTLPNYNMDEDEITKLTINGNTAEIEYECGRAYDESNNKGQARAIYDPVTKTMTFKIIKAPDGCWHENWGPLKFQKAEE